MQKVKEVLVAQFKLGGRGGGGNFTFARPISSKCLCPKISGHVLEEIAVTPKISCSLNKNRGKISGHS